MDQSNRPVFFQSWINRFIERCLLDFRRLARGYTGDSGLAVSVVEGRGVLAKSDGAGQAPNLIFQTDQILQ